MDELIVVVIIGFSVITAMIYGLGQDLGAIRESLETIAKEFQPRYGTLASKVTDKLHDIETAINNQSN